MQKFRLFHHYGYKTPEEIATMILTLTKSELLTIGEAQMVFTETFTDKEFVLALLKQVNEHETGNVSNALRMYS